MGVNTKIEWADNTFNPWIGCTKVSAGCKFCYAEKDMDQRRKRVTWGINGTRSVTSYQYWRKVLSWEREAKETGVKKRVFCASLADVFEDWDGHVIDSKGEPLYWNNRQHDRGSDYAALKSEIAFGDCDSIPTFSHYPLKRLTDETSSQEFMQYQDWLPLSLDMIREHLFHLIEATPNLIWLLLTKRPENINRMVPERWHLNGFPSNVWIGTSVEDQEQALKRIPHLVKVPAVIKFLSCEPLLGPVNITNRDLKNAYSVPTRYDEMNGKKVGIEWTDPGEDYIGIDWVIAGGESGPEARVPHPDWFRSLRDQCTKSNTSFLFKQWGEWAPPAEGQEYDTSKGRAGKAFLVSHDDGTVHCFKDTAGNNPHVMLHVGKKNAGRDLDGKQYDQIPL